MSPDRGSSASRRTITRLARVVGRVVVMAALIAVVACGRRVPDGPEPVAWNHQPCAHCRMLVGEPAHAAQLITRDGDVAHFDDPGCLFEYLDDRQPQVHRLWFHDSRTERWLSRDDVGFLTGATTPMGFGLAAVPRATPGAISFDDARRQVATRPDGGGGHGGHGDSGGHAGGDHGHHRGAP